MGARGGGPTSSAREKFLNDQELVVKKVHKNRQLIKKNATGGKQPRGGSVQEREEKRANVRAKAKKKTREGRAQGGWVENGKTGGILCLTKGSGGGVVLGARGGGVGGGWGGGGGGGVGVVFLGGIGDPNWS